MVFGPQPRTYGPKVPKKLRRLAIQSALNARALDGDLALIEPIRLDAPKTSELAGLLERIDRYARARDPRIVEVMASCVSQDRRVLIVDSEGRLATDVRQVKSIPEKKSLPKSSRTIRIVSNESAAALHYKVISLCLNHSKGAGHRCRPAPGANMDHGRCAWRV